MSLYLAVSVDGRMWYVVAEYLAIGDGNRCGMLHRRTQRVCQEGSKEPGRGD
jgi:hypothetical protein